MYVEKWLSESVFSELTSNSAYTPSCHLLEHPVAMIKGTIHYIRQKEMDRVTDTCSKNYAFGHVVTLSVRTSQNAYRASKAAIFGLCLRPAQKRQKC